MKDYSSMLKALTEELWDLMNQKCETEADICRQEERLEDINKKINSINKELGVQRQELRNQREHLKEYRYMVSASN